MEKTHAVYSTKTKIVRLIIWLFLAFVAVITIFPVCYVIFGSFKDNKELLVGGSSILPQKWAVWIIMFRHGSRQILQLIQ